MKVEIRAVILVANSSHVRFQILMNVVMVWPRYLNLVVHRSMKRESLVNDFNNLQKIKLRIDMDIRRG